MLEILLSTRSPGGSSYGPFCHDTARLTVCSSCLQLCLITFHRYNCQSTHSITVNDQQVGHVNQVGHLSKPPLNLLEFTKLV